MRKAFTLGGVFTAVEALITYFLVPHDLKPTFIVLAAVMMIAGYAIGHISSGKAKRSRTKVVLLLAAAVVCSASAIAYMIMINMGSSDISDVVMIAVVFAAFFGAFAFLTAFSGLKLDKLPGLNQAGQ
jgi:hypothetical protein